MNILVTGGAGYIGSHTAYLLDELNYNVIVLDDLSSGHKDLVPKKAKFYKGSTGDEKLLNQIFSENQIEAVIHFAAFIEVEESTKNPLKYYKNNTTNAIHLLQACIDNNVRKFIFSSTAAVYGEPKTTPVEESTKTVPINPYGRSKLCTEMILNDLAQAEAANNNSFNFVALRYFNVAGACKNGEIGQISKKSTHLIKVAAEAATQKRDGMKIFGDQFPTNDGTCVRDYIHVDDLAEVHVEALKYLLAGGTSNTFNCGYGHGYSVKEVISTMKKVSDHNFKVEMAPPRDGDPAELVANSNKAKSILKWEPKYDDINYICKTAFEWEKKLT